MLRTLADELAPGADFGGDLAFGILPQAALGYLLCEGLDEQLRAASVVEERQTEVDSISGENSQHMHDTRMQKQHLPPRNVILID